MSMTVKITNRVSVGNRVGLALALTFDASYPSQGYPLTPQAVGLHTFSYVDVGAATQPGQAQPGAAYVASYDATQKTIRLFETGTAVSTALTETAAATDVHLYSANAFVTGY